MVDLSARDPAIGSPLRRVPAVALLVEHLAGELPIVLSRPTLGVVGEDGGVAGGLAELGILADDGLEDEILEPLPDPTHHVVAPICAAVEPTAEDAGDADLRVQPLPHHLDVAEQLG